MSIKINGVVIECDICLCEFEWPATPLVAPIRSWSAHQALAEAIERGWTIENEGKDVNCPSCSDEYDDYVARCKALGGKPLSPFAYRRYEA